MEVELTAANFDREVLSSDVPVIVDFWAEWCMPCKMVAPVLQELAGAYAGKLKVGKVNVDDQAELAARYSIVSIPTLLLFKGGEQVGQQVGAAPRPKIEQLIKPHL
ncbi:MAG: thioredoxin [Spirochaetaceae bacterium]|nr:MAG: thioredoxin [Spirochaetaceae bacterium]